jgi:methylmalonyl-CoA mutase N-terminal domain/subunit
MFTKDILEEDKKLAEQWQAEATKRYKQETLEALKLASSSGIEVKPYYTPSDIQDLNYAEETPPPGLYPYTRATYPLTYQVFRWATQQAVGTGLPETTRQRYDLLRQHGRLKHYKYVVQITDTEFT